MSLYAIELGSLPLANLLRLRAKSITTKKKGKFDPNYRRIGKGGFREGLELDNNYININLEDEAELREAMNRLDVENSGPGSNIPSEYSSDGSEITFEEYIRLLITISKKSIRIAYAEAEEIFENSIIEVIEKSLPYNNIGLEAI
ncbi:uncharacterized protein RAG0_10630 [Rhynchosporium agropyri]|uniref:Uncharacterized protein n=1 Tax=Rhynchosporium agropyri TaxID=914238 RepID=A0A1E1L0N7_9HELO|nr:uncharacterized protein RAG0_10630 [Rhynchosporium agropyri]